MKDELQIAELTRRLVDFANERDWAQFHDPKNPVMALSSGGAIRAPGSILTPKTLENNERSNQATRATDESDASSRTIA